MQTPLQKAIKYVSVTHIVLASLLLTAVIFALLCLSGGIEYDFREIIISLYGSEYYYNTDLELFYYVTIINASTIFTLAILGIIYSKRSYLLPKSFIIAYAIIFAIIDTLTAFILTNPL